MKNNSMRLLGFILVAMMLASLFTLSAFAEDTNVAEVNGVGYATLQAAINAAEDGDTVTLLKDITLGTYKQKNTDAAITIKKAITLDGNGHTFTSKAGRAINVDVAGEVEIKNLTIKQYCGRGSNDQKRCINVINQTATLKVTDCTLEMVEHYADGRTLTSYVAGVQAATGAEHNITISGCEIKTIYGIVIYAADTTVDVENTAISNALYGAWINAASTVNFVNSTVTTKEDMGTNNLAIGLLVQANGVSITADENTTINTPAPKGADGTQTGGQGYIMYSSAKMADLGNIDLYDATFGKVNADDPVIYLAYAEAQIYYADGIVMYDTLEDAIPNLTIKHKLEQLQTPAGETYEADYVNEKLLALYLEDPSKNFYFVDPTSDALLCEARIGNTIYTTLVNAAAAAKEGDTITALIDITAGTVVIGEGITLDLQGFTLTLTEGLLSLNGSCVTGELYDASNNEGAKIIGNVAATGTYADDEASYMLVPMNGAYVFTRAAILDTPSEANPERGVTYDEATDTYNAQFKVKWDAFMMDAEDGVLVNGTYAEHGIKIVILVTWDGGEQAYYYSDADVQACSAMNPDGQNYDYTFALKANGRENLTITILAVADCGTIAAN